MNAKPEAKAMAISLRKEGLSMKEIARRISCSSSSVCLWVKDVEISAEQKKRLASLSHGNRQKASRVYVEKCQNLREDWREEGREKARSGDLAHAIACTIYWAEGTKKKNLVSLANTDPQMIKLFYEFLVKNFNVKPKVSFSYHQDEGNASEPDTRAFWSNHLGVGEDEIHSFANKDKRARTGFKKNRHLYGMCILTLGSTAVAQHIYGALEVYGGVKLGLS